MDHRQSNEIISDWAGLPCKCEGSYWGKCPMHEHGNEPRPYTKDNRAAVELLAVLMLKDCPHSLSWDSRWQKYNFEVSVWHPQEGFKTYAASRRTVAEAVTSAILLMVEKEST